MKTEQYSLGAPFYKDTNSFEGRKSKANGFPAPQRQQSKEVFPNGQHIGDDTAMVQVSDMSAKLSGSIHVLLFESIKKMKDRRGPRILFHGFREPRRSGNVGRVGDPSRRLQEAIA